MIKKMTVNVYVALDERYHRMKRIYDDCVAEDIPIPEMVRDFFDDCDPAVYRQLKAYPCLYQVSSSSSSAAVWEFDLTELPIEPGLIKVEVTEGTDA